MSSDRSSVMSEMMSGTTLAQRSWSSQTDLTIRDTRSTFQRALDDYIQGLPEKKQKRKFIVACASLGSSATPEAINEAIQRAEEKKTSKRAIKNIMSPVINALKDYAGIIDLLASAGPMPTAIIWGALKVVIEGAQRYLSLFDTIKSELRSLASETQRITEYEYLYGESERMQMLFYNSYINMLRFWSKVDRECDRCYFSSICRAATSFSTKKLNEIIQDIKDDADDIEETATLVEARLAKGEREEAKNERREAAGERLKAQAERRAAEKWRAEQKADQQVDRYRQISEWLRSKYSNESNFNRHQANQVRWLPGTCDWLHQHHYYGAWVDGSLKPPVMWIRAPPGYGKSVLCSFAVRSVQDNNPKAAVAYHFCQFDQPYTATEVLRLLGDQLFEAFWKGTEQVDEEMYLLTQRSACSLDHIKRLLDALTKKLPLVFIFVDGLDEEQEYQRWSEISIVIDYLNQLTTEHPDTVRVWYSSQPRTYITEKLTASHVVDIQVHAGPDVTLFLSRAIPEVDELGDGGNELIDALVDRADGNFLWASLMIKALREEVNTLREMRKFIQNGLPTELDGYYQRIFDRIEKPQRGLACKVFSLLAHARRRLRLGEIREAIGLLQSKSPATPLIDDMPFIQRLVRISAPLIEIDNKNSNQSDCVCHITHSSVLDFLLRHPDILGPHLRISPSIIANACILYLRQDRYSQLLERDGSRWFDATGQPIDQHQFILYAAKYWDRHLDTVAPTKALQEAVNDFLISTNFQTCIQVQCLWVDGKFDIFRVNGLPDHLTFLVRVLPRWFVQGSAEARKKWRDYRHFVHQWRSFLSCASCCTPNCEVLASPGEVDRCWWAALGPQNFLSKMPGRYTSFCFQPDDDVEKGRGQTFEAPSSRGDQLKILRVEARTEDTLTLTCEHWDLKAGSTPSKTNQQQILVRDEPRNWLLYSKPSIEDSKALAGKAALAAFSDDCQFLRIGVQIFALNSDLNEYHPIIGMNSTTSLYPSYVEEFAVRGGLVVLASRRELTPDFVRQNGLRDRVVEDFGMHLTGLEERMAEGEDAQDADSEEPQSSEESEAYDDTTSEDEAYETWSENSTILSEDFIFEDDIILPTGRPIDMESENSESSTSSEHDSEAEENDKPNPSPNSSDPELPAHAVVGYGRWDSDDEYFWDMSDEEYLAYVPPLLSRKAREPQVSISVFNTNPNVAERIFHLSLPLRFRLFDSPPAIHPTEPLIVWPIGGGDVLFADVQRKTYFTRRTRPSTTYTRHIFMKCHFSPSGQHLHIVALEGRKKPAPRTPSKANKPLKLALLVTTYRLSNRKTTHSPPTLIHRSRVNLGSTYSLPVSSLPFSLTWTPKLLYFTVSRKVLKVYRIRLFPDPAANEAEGRFSIDRNAVLVPRKLIFLPDTAAGRAVHFFPAPDGGESTEARIIIGTENRGSAVYMGSTGHEGAPSNELHVVEMSRDVKGLKGMLSPPVGCFVDEQSDLGGWVKSSDRTEVADDMGIGRLDRRREKFDFEDDCDLEPYIF
ncbi:nacht and ankyrin domain protein [Moniliophthora roreri]|nr:nacht and ankyrin domain protein [Moniliophthora roreri]